MSELTELVEEYMDFRAARGFQPSRKIQRLLTQFAASLPVEPGGKLVFSEAQALAWAHASERARPAWWSARLSMVRGFANYLAGSGLPVDVPAIRLGPSTGRDRRAVPYLYSLNDIRALMDAAQELFTPLRSATMRTLIGLLAVTGMRIGETLQLTVGDVDFDKATVLIRHAKYGRQRMIVLDPSSCVALRGYLDNPVRHWMGVGPDSAVLVTHKGTALNVNTARSGFHQMVARAGLSARAGARPRLHDFRHTFATQSMIDAYQQDRDPARTLTLLSVWLGHSNPADTYWYVQASPEIAAVAAKRLESGPRP